MELGLVAYGGVNKGGAVARRAVCWLRWDTVLDMQQNLTLT